MQKNIIKRLNNTIVSKQVIKFNYFNKFDKMNCSADVFKFDGRTGCYCVAQLGIVLHISIIENDGLIQASCEVNISPYQPSGL